MIKVSSKYGLILGGVTILCTFLVSSVYVIVGPIILERTIQKVRDNLGQIFTVPDFTYDEITDSFAVDTAGDFDALYKVTLPEGNTNYVYEMSPEGRNDKILYLIAYDTMGTVVKIQYVQMRETKGRGDKIVTPEYLKKIYQQNAAKMKVPIITGATYSTKAMKQSIEASSRHLMTEVLK